MIFAVPVASVLKFLIPRLYQSMRAGDELALPESGGRDGRLAGDALHYLLPCRALLLLRMYKAPLPSGAAKDLFAEIEFARDFLPPPWYPRSALGRLR